MDESRVYRIARQKIEVSATEFPCQGWVLDIGGGGEGIIGQLLGERVIAIDPIKRELEEAPAGALKVLMDARDLKFLDGTFGTVTSFFTLLFIAKPDHEKVFREVARVLRSGGEFHVWDAVVPPHDGGTRDIFAVPLEVHFDGRVDRTGYGALWPDNQRDMGYYLELAGKTGFETLVTVDGGQTFHFKFRRRSRT